MSSVRRKPAEGTRALKKGNPVTRRERRNRAMAKRNQWECPRCLQIFSLAKQPNIAEEHPNACIEKQVRKEASDDNPRN